MKNNSPDVSGDDEAESVENGECFVIAPIGNDGTDTRERTEDLLEYVIKPVIERELGLSVEVAHHIDEPGNITRQVMRKLFEAELVIADLTEQNPNVMYELAVRHATGKPVVTIAEEGASLPFDVGPQRTKFYKHTMGGPEAFKPELQSSAEAALTLDHQPDNPIYDIQGDFQIIESDETDEVGHLLRRLDQIESRITAPPTGFHSGNRLSLRATGGIEAHSEEVDEDVLLVKGDVIAGGPIGTHGTSPFKEMEAYHSGGSSQAASTDEE